MKKIISLIVIFTILMLGTVSAKSLYVIADINANPTPIQAYDIQADGSVVYQATHSVTNWKFGAVGLAIDTDSEFLFVTYEGSNIIQLLDATTMSDEGTTTATGASNLAGIVVDQDLQKVYTIDRDTATLYVYSWNAGTKALTLDGTQTLSGVSMAQGIALDEINDLLYVGDRTTTVRYFNTGSWSSAGSFVVSQAAMGIAVDVANGYVYTGNAYSGYGSTHLLSQYDLNTDTESTLNIATLTGYSGDNVVGLAVDQSTSRLYITTGDQATGGSDKLIAFDSSMSKIDETSDIGNPTGLAIPWKDISYNPLNLEKDDGFDGQCVDPDYIFTYMISFDNQNQNDVTGVVITDTLPPEVSFVSATDGGTYDSGEVTWIIGTLTNGESGHVELTVQVNSGTEGSTFINYATIDSDNTPPTTKSETTDVCEDGGDDEIPEFGVLASLTVLVLAGLFIYKKRK